MRTTHCKSIISTKMKTSTFKSFFNNSLGVKNKSPDDALCFLPCHPDILLKTRSQERNCSPNFSLPITEYLKMSLPCFSFIRLRHVCYHCFSVPPSDLLIKKLVLVDFRGIISCTTDNILLYNSADRRIV